MRKNSPEYPVYYKKKPSPIRMHTLTASLMLNMFFVVSIYLYAMGYVHTSRTVAMIQPGMEVASIAPDYLSEMHESAPVILKHGKR